MVKEPLPLDVLDRLTSDFRDRADAVAEVLLTRRRIGSEDFLGDRLLRCVVHAACGEEQRVLQLLDLARREYRDVIMAAEYDGLRQIRDLRASFVIDCPEKFWVGEVACIMASRGYRLVAMQACAAIAGPFDYTSDYSEGRATFVGPKGDIAIEKKDRQWMIFGNRREIAIHELNHPFSDELAFRDAVSGYLLSNVRVTDSEPKELPATQTARPWWKLWR